MKFSCVEVFQTFSTHHYWRAAARAEPFCGETELKSVQYDLEAAPKPTETLVVCAKYIRTGRHLHLCGGAGEVLLVQIGRQKKTLQEKSKSSFSKAEKSGEETTNQASH